ncbi:MAG: peptidylprolyl isomerase [Hellea sp.]|nr:peptidylprolyl isomerase [Hellea sp.]
MTRFNLKSIILGSAACLASFAAAPVASAQVNHGISAVVNDDIITSHDLRQRVLFMLATTGVERTEESLARVQAQALRNLVDEKIQIQEAQKYEQDISEEEVNRSVAALISRNGLDANDVVQRLAQAGISIRTLQDQVESEIAWQRIVNGLYGSRIRISDAQINETLNRLTANASKPSYNVAEIYIEASPEIGGMDGALKGAQAMIAQVQQGAPFPLLAQQFSSAPSASAGGVIGFVREGELRPELNEVLLQMEVGAVSDPIQVPGGYYVIALVEKETSETETLYRLKQVNYLADSQDEKDAAKGKLIALQGKLTSCDTLTKDIEAHADLRQADMGELKTSDLAETILEKLAETDVGGLSDPIETPSGVAAIMVCDRSLSGSNVPTRDEIEDRLMDQQLAQASKRHLRDLRRQATIVIR